tara:strand:- start:820 stop:999 length:180 start_codon:yes stop_codon:yes gene_type:complete
MVTKTEIVETLVEHSTAVLDETTTKVEELVRRAYEEGYSAGYSFSKNEKKLVDNVVESL